MLAWLRNLFVGQSKAGEPKQGDAKAASGAGGTFLVQRANVGENPSWRTLCSTPSEEYAREIYNKQLTLSATGQFRLLNSAGQVLAEAKSQPLSERKVFENYGPSAYYVPEKPPPRKR